MTLIGVPIDSVGRSGGAELAPAALREVGVVEALGGEDGGDLNVSIRGDKRDPQTGILASPALVGASLACYNPEKDPDRACGRALVAALSRSVV